ncbi:MAG: GDP-mannose 4,6-dehydratase [Candidatus Omnitrophota bacterium]
MRVLITGISGFAGGHLAEFLLGRKGVEIYGTMREGSKLNGFPFPKDRIRLRTCDLRDPSAVRAVLSEVKPDRLFHLAGQTFVPDSWKDPGRTFDANVIGELNLFEAARHLGLKTRVHVACSSDEYGAVLPGDLPIDESVPLRPLSPYAVSKAAQDLLAYQYFHSFGFSVVRTRAFSHTGPRQREMFAASSFARQIALVEAGKQKPEIYVGNLEAVRDFSDVRDIVRAYWLALEKGEPGEVYNICSGRGRKIAEVLDALFSMTRARIKIKKDPSRMREADVPALVGDASKFRKRTGWKPAVPFKRTLSDLLSHWRKNVRARAV